MRKRSGITMLRRGKKQYPLFKSGRIPISRRQLSYVNVLKKRTLNKYRRLPIFNRKTGERERAQRRIAERIFRKEQINPAFSYPGDNNRTRSISQRSFAKQTAGLKSSSYFINQYRGGMQDNTGGISAKLPWASPSTDILAYQARKVLGQEEQERIPSTDFFDQVVNRRTRNEEAPRYNTPEAQPVQKRDPPPSYRTFYS